MKTPITAIISAITDNDFGATAEVGKLHDAYLAETKRNGAALLNRQQFLQEMTRAGYQLYRIAGKNVYMSLRLRG